MNRPLMLRLLPGRLRVAAWERLYRGRRDQWQPLYHGSSLAYAPQVRMELVPGDIVSDRIAFTGLYDLPLTRRIVALGRRGGTMVDVGANLGYFALLWAAQHPSNRCVAFEASPRVLELLRSNVLRNGFDGRIEVVPLAAGSATGTMPFDMGPSDQMGWGGFHSGAGVGSIEVDVVRVDDVVRPAGPIALLKVDVEGAEVLALQGCERLLTGRLVQEIWYEENKPRMKALGIRVGAIQDYLGSMGYRSSPHGDPSAETLDWSAVPA